MATVSPSPAPNGGFVNSFPLPSNGTDNGEEQDGFELGPLSQLPDGEWCGDNDPAIGCMLDTEDAHFAAQLMCGDIRDDENRGNSAKDKKDNALKHLNFFLKHYSRQKSYQFVKAEELEFEATEEHIGWWDDMIGCFFAYLAKQACCNCDPSKERIAYNTATGYASSVKAYYSNKFRTRQQEIPVFQTNRWKALRARLLSNYEEENRVTGKSLVNPHEASSNEDREAISTGCIWLNTPKAAEFWHINVTMTQYTGRGSEVALDRRSRMGTTEINELHYSYHVLQPKLKRQKFGEESLLCIYPHKNSALQDYYFSLFHRIIMLGDDDDYIFPEFARKAANQTDSKSDSKVSSLWSANFSELYKSFICLNEKLNKTLTSHCHKKGSSQLMAETPGVSGLAQIFRAGWQVRGFHSIFDYIVGSTVMQQQAGKAVSGWTAKIGDVVCGGQPPNLADIHTSRELLQPFVSHLFINDSDNQWSPLVRDLLVASMLRHYDEFCAILKAEPDNKFECLDSHLFVARIKEKLYLAGATDAIFEEWKKETRLGFFNRNLPALAITNYPRHLGDVSNPFHQVMLDPRCFVDHINALSAHYQALHNLSCQQTTDIRQLTGLVRGLQGQVQKQTELLDFLVAGRNQQQIAVPVSPSAAGSPSKNSTDLLEASPASYVKRFSVGFSALGQRCTISDRFVFFFAEMAKAGYEKDKDTAGVSQEEKKKTRNDFTRLKRTVKIMLLFCESYPSPRPTNAADLQQWLSDLRRMAVEAENSLRTLFYPEIPEKIMLQSALTGKAITSAMKEWENVDSSEHRDLPENTPVEIIEWFAGAAKTAEKKRKAAGDVESNNS